RGGTRRSVFRERGLRRRPPGPRRARPRTAEMPIDCRQGAAGRPRTLRDGGTRDGRTAKNSVRQKCRTRATRILHFELRRRAPYCLLTSVIFTQPVADDVWTWM